MVKSYMMKDASGKTAGYIQPVQDRVRYRVMKDSGGTADEIWLLFEDGTYLKRALNGSGEECECPLEGKKIRGGCVTCGGVCYAATNREARRWLDVKLKQEVRAACAHEEEPKPRETAEAPAKESPKREKWYEMPQRRWPPPPCWQYSCYKNGRWQENHQR